MYNISFEIISEIKITFKNGDQCFKNILTYILYIFLFFLQTLIKSFYIFCFILLDAYYRKRRIIFNWKKKLYFIHRKNW